MLQDTWDKGQNGAKHVANGPTCHEGQALAQRSENDIPSCWLGVGPLTPEYDCLERAGPLTRAKLLAMGGRWFWQYTVSPVRLVEKTWVRNTWLTHTTLSEHCESKAPMPSSSKTNWNGPPSISSRTTSPLNLTRDTMQCILSDTPPTRPLPHYLTDMTVSCPLRVKGGRSQNRHQRPMDTTSTRTQTAITEAYVAHVWCPGFVCPCLWFARRAEANPATPTFPRLHMCESWSAT